MTALRPDQASPARAEAAFAFLADLGFRPSERWVTGGQSFRDGWRLVYSAPALTVTVQYLDMQFEVLFAWAGIDVDYLFIAVNSSAGGVVFMATCFRLRMSARAHCSWQLAVRSRFFWYRFLGAQRRRSHGSS